MGEPWHAPPRFQVIAEAMSQVPVVSAALVERALGRKLSQEEPGAVAGLARLDGQPVGLLANDCHFYAGSMTAAAAQNTRRMVELCDSCHLPVVNLIDEPGFMLGPEAERVGVIRYGMAAVAAAATVPWATVQIQQCFGVAGAAHFGPDAYMLLWPSAPSGALPLEGGVAVAYHRDIAAADPTANR